MALTLSILRCPDGVPPETREVGGGEFSIGRGADNDWVLPDPERHLSKRHLMVAFRAGGWQVADLSANGTYLNRAVEPIGPGTAAELRDGDRLRLGAYEIEVRVSQVQPVARQPGQVRDPFGDDPFATPGGRGANPFDDDPLLRRPSAQGVSLPPDYDPLAPEPAGDGFLGPVQQDHSPAFEDAFVAPPKAVSLLPDDWEWDAAPGQPPSPPAAAAPAIAPPVRAEKPGLLAAFLRGAGLPEARPADPEATMQALGEAFRAVVEGLREAMIARAAVKGEFRIEQTMIRARGNNPLKFSADADDALAALLGVGRRTDMTPGMAIAEALRDMRHHELASIAAMQSAARALVAGFDPAKIEREAGSGMAVLPGQRRSRAWDAFEALHGRVTMALSDDWDSVFGRAFARAYEQALRDISEKERPA